ncbi:MAG: sugar ABC transporter permease [Spirochaetes bacterium DG_61]|jgi:simple sugar transport system permease protein|nr:MAG: sugar ABC transporter permease [Spirochaetes bacterium DG_61]
MRRFLKYHESYVLIVIVVLAIAITSINKQFFTLENLFDLLKSYSFLGILAVGVLIVLVSGGIDISFTAMTSVAEYVMAIYIINLKSNILIAFLISILVGIALGAFNATLIHFLRIPTIITTIATLNIYYGLLSFFSGGKWIYNLPDWFRNFSVIEVIKLVNREGIGYGLSIVTLIWIFVILLAFFILRYTTLGRSIYAMGGNRISAQRVGLNILRLHFFVYCFMGLLSGIAAVVHALLVMNVAPNAIVGKELDVIAAVVLGGANLAGGAGSLLGTIFGVILVALMSNGITLMRVSSLWYNVFIGLIIMVSVSMSAHQLKIKQRQRAVIDVE